MTASRCSSVNVIEHVGATPVLGRDMRAVGEQHLEQVDGGWRAEDGPEEPRCAQTRQKTAVIDVRMCEHHELDIGRLETEGSKVVVVGIPATLEHPAVDQKVSGSTVGRDLNPVTRTCDFRGCPFESDVHGNPGWRVGLLLPAQL